jgi:uncharacterized membrane protein
MNDMIGEPRVVEAGRGAAWWGGGWRIFRSSVWTWIGIMIIYLLVMALINLVPYIGGLGSVLLTPVFVGGFMLGCDAIERGQPLRVAHMFEGFQGAHFVPLMIIGAVNIGMTVGIALITTAGVLGSIKFADMARIGAGGDPFDALSGTAHAMTGTGMLMGVIGLVIAAVLAMLNWFAPALVALRGTTAIEAMKLSFLGSLRNWVPFLVYGLIGMAVFITCAIVFFFAAAMFGGGALLTGDPFTMLATAMIFFAVAALVAAVLGLFVGPIVLGSIHASYKDTFATEDTGLGNPAYR